MSPAASADLLTRIHPVRRHLDRDLDQIRTSILELGVMVEQATHTAVRSLVEGKVALARDVIEGDRRIDAREIEVEEECLKTLALHQPVAGDLRLVIAILKVNNDLERVGDLARNIAERAIELTPARSVILPDQVIEMAERSRTMLREALQSIMRADASLARKVLRDDEDVDNLHREMYGLTTRAIVEKPEDGEQAMRLLSVSRCLERIADLATNMAEDVVFLVDGEVIRHQEKLAMKKD